MPKYLGKSIVPTTVNVITLGSVCYQRSGSATVPPTTITSGPFTGNTFASCTACEAPVNACAGSPDCTGHVGSPGVAPSIVLKIGHPGASYVGGGITWCGFTWTQTDINANNVEKCACPSRYNLDQNFTVPSSATNREWWSNTYGAVNLDIRRQIFFTNFISTNYYFRNKQWFMDIDGASGTIVNPRDNRQLQQYKFGNPTAFSGTNLYTTYELGILNPANAAYDPTTNNYKIADQQFGTFTNSNGVEFTFSRGTNW